MKHVYFVRHGESEGNAGVARGRDSDRLTAKGLQQAQLIAERCTHLPIDAIISSTIIRTRQTAEVIAQKLDLIPSYTDVFVERKTPTEVQGKLRDDPEVQRIETLLWENFHVADYHYTDEENFQELNSRAAEALAYLAERPEKNILVVTHGYFMRIIMAKIVLGESLTAQEGKAFAHTFHLENTGLTVVGYDTARPWPWWVWIWNDHAHLGM